MEQPPNEVDHKSKSQHNLTRKTPSKTVTKASSFHHNHSAPTIGITVTPKSKHVRSSLPNLHGTVPINPESSRIELFPSNVGLTNKYCNIRNSKYCEITISLTPPPEEPKHEHLTPVQKRFLMANESQPLSKSKKSKFKAKASVK